MSRRAFGWWVVALSLSAGPAMAGEKNDTGVSTPADIVKLIQESKVEYSVAPLDKLTDVKPSDFAEKMWPAINKATSMPFVRKGKNGTTSIVTYPIADAAIESMNEAGRAFEKKDYATATTAYLDVLEKFPDTYRAHLYLGDTYFTGAKDNVKALAEFREASRLNPYDALNYTYEGNALVRLRKNDEAVEAWVHALSLRAYHEPTMKLAEQFAGTLGIRPRRDRFQPRAFVRREGNKIAMYVDSQDVETPWLSWAMCKAAWMGEPDYRKKRGAPGDGRWTSTEDQECMSHLLILYELGRQDGTVKQDPQLERWKDVGKNGMLNEFVAYEFGSRMSPDLLLSLSSSPLDFEKYVRTYVLPKALVSKAVSTGK